MIFETTTRLKLIAGTRELAEAEISDVEEFGRLLDSTIPVNWPPVNLKDALGYFLGLYREQRNWESWLTWYAVRVDESGPVLCGGIGFKGPPDKRGMVEIGYSVLPEYQGKGLATEMVSGLLRWAKRQPAVRIIEAEANPENKASIRVLEKNGFSCTGTGGEINTIRFRHIH